MLAILQFLPYFIFNAPQNILKFSPHHYSSGYFPKPFPHTCLHGFSSLSLFPTPFLSLFLCRPIWLIKPLQFLYFFPLLGVLLWFCTTKENLGAGSGRQFSSLETLRKGQDYESSCSDNFGPYHMCLSMCVFVCTCLCVCMS